MKSSKKPSDPSGHLQFRVFELQNSRRLFCGGFPTLDLATAVAIQHTWICDTGNEVIVTQPHTNKVLRHLGIDHDENNNPCVFDAMTNKVLDTRVLDKRK